MKGTAARALLLGLAIAFVLGLLHRWGVGLPLLLGLLVLIGLIAGVYRPLGVRAFDGIWHSLRALAWRGEHGRHHSFSGIQLNIEEHAGRMWMAAEGYQRAAQRPEPEAVTLARFAGRWRRNEQQQLMLEVAAVAQHLNTMPGREEPRVQRLRRYLEHDVLFPASRRRERQRTGDN